MRAANARPRGLHPRRFAPMAARSARAHQVTNARPRPSAWALNSRPWQLATARAHQEDSARARGLHPRRFAPMAARSARAHREDSARARGLHPRRFAPMAARSARAHREDSTRSRGLHPGQFAPMAACSARAHREDSARARRRRVKVSSTFSKVAGAAGARWAPSSARSPLPRRSVLDVCHWQTAPEAAAEKGGSAPKVL